MSRAAAALAAALVLTRIGAACADEALTLPSSRAGVTVPILFIAAEKPPAASVVLFVGGDGIVPQSQQNFLMRVRHGFANRGLNVAVEDVPSDHRHGLDTYYRASAEQAQDTAAVVAFLKTKAPVPVWLVGTSNGSISAANGAVRLGASQLGGVVLTSAVWSGGMSLVPYQQIALPVLVVHNRSDTCPAATPAGADLALTQLAAAPAKELLAVSGGTAKSRPCEALAPHGYYEIEDQVVPPIVRWIVEHSRGGRPN